MQSRLKAGRLLLNKKDFAGALVQFSALAAIDSTGKKVPGITPLLATAYEGAGNSPKAISIWEKETRV